MDGFREALQALRDIAEALHLIAGLLREVVREGSAVNVYTKEG